MYRLTIKNGSKLHPVLEANLAKYCFVLINKDTYECKRTVDTRAGVDFYKKQLAPLKVEFNRTGRVV